MYIRNYFQTTKNYIKNYTKTSNNNPCVSILSHATNFAQQLNLTTAKARKTAIVFHKREKLYALYSLFAQVHQINVHQFYLRCFITSICSLLLVKPNNWNECGGPNTLFRILLWLGFWLVLLLLFWCWLILLCLILIVTFLIIVCLLWLVLLC